MVWMKNLRSLSYVLFVLGIIARNPLVEPDESFGWTELANFSGVWGGEKWTSHIINITSQRWLKDSDFSSSSECKSLWWHYLVLTVPSALPHNSSEATLYLSGGDRGMPVPSESNPLVMSSVARAIQLRHITAVLYQVPNQGVVFQLDSQQRVRDLVGMTEFTWDIQQSPHFKSTPEVLVKFPCVKAGLRAMDVVEDYMSRSHAIPPITFTLMTDRHLQELAWLMQTIDDNRVTAVRPITLKSNNLQLSDVFSPHFNQNSSGVITANVMGGLGNQLFIVFTTINFALRHGYRYEFKYSDTSPSSVPRSTYWSSILSMIPTVQSLSFTQYVTYQEASFSTFIDLPAGHAAICLNGYFQSHKYLNLIQSHILDVLQAGVGEEAVKEAQHVVSGLRIQARGRPIIFVHVRCGWDYIDSHILFVLPLQYYINAFKSVLKEQPDAFFVFFTDNEDRDRVEKRFSHFNITSVHMKFDLSDVVTLLVMSMLDGAVIANSSFSWWGAFLQDLRREAANQISSPEINISGESLKKQGLIIAPRVWFSDRVDQSQDRLPDNWIKLLDFEND